jgi:hypothetical protein
MAVFTPTDEQTEIIDRFRDGWSFVVEAGAGTGKTRTLAEAAATRPGRPALYLAYNKAIVEDSKGAFPQHVTCKTAHSIAFASVGCQYVEMLNTGSNQGWQIAKTMGVSRWVGEEGKVSGPGMASIARRTIDQWAASTDQKMATHHVPVPNGIADCDKPGLRQVALGHAERLWSRVVNPEQRLFRFSHDWYLKLFSMMNGGGPPILPVDAILFDECQDADPVMRLIFEAQPGIKVAVGDSQQSIYAWRGAENAIEHFRAAGAPVSILSKSWRFGESIANEANRWLEKLDADLRLTGNQGVDSRLGEFDQNLPHAVLCRTNSGVIASVMEAQQLGHKVAMVRCGPEVKRLVSACERLHAGREVDHPELVAFPTWKNLVDYIEGSDCNNPMLRTLVRLASVHTPEVLRKALHACVDEKSAHTIVSTAHSAKGREWPLVRIAGDFPPPAITKDNPSGKPKVEDLRLAYVAVTRAKETLDRSAMQTDAPAGTLPYELRVESSSLF